MGLLDDIRKALESEKTSEFIDQILKEKSLHNALHDAGYTIVVDDPQARARQQPFGLLSTLHKIDLVDLITEITTIKTIDLVSLITRIATIGTIESMTLLERITQIDKIHPDPSFEAVTNGTFETGDLTGWGGNYSYATNEQAHTGTYSAYIHAGGNILQYLSTPILVECIKSFTFWLFAGGFTRVFIFVHYTDGSSMGHEFADNFPIWTELDVLPYLESGKTVDEINIVASSPYSGYVDDVSIIAEGAHTVIDKIVSMPAVTGSVTVKGSENQLLLQRALTYDLIVQLRSDGVEIDPRTIRALTASDIVTVNNLLNPHPVSLASIPNPPNLDVALSTRALESGGNLAAILARLDVALSTRALESGGNLASIKAKTDNLDVLLSTRFKPTDSIGNTSFGATQATRTSLKVQPEREDIVSLGGVASPNAAGVQIVAPSGSLVPKVYDAEYEGLADGLHYFYFGTSTSPTTKRFLSRNTKGVNSKTFVQPRVGAAGDGIYLYSSVAETNMPYDLGYTLE